MKERHTKDREKQREIINKRRKTGTQRVCEKKERQRMKEKRKGTDRKAKRECKKKGRRKLKR